MVWPNSTGFRGISYLTSRSRCDQSDYRYAVIGHYGTFGIQLKAPMMPLQSIQNYGSEDGNFTFELCDS